MLKNLKNDQEKTIFLVCTLDMAEPTFAFDITSSHNPSDPETVVFIP